jgi:hypothetical protein
MGLALAKVPHRTSGVDAAMASLTDIPETTARLRHAKAAEPA